MNMQLSGMIEVGEIDTLSSGKCHPTVKPITLGLREEIDACLF